MQDEKNLCTPGFPGLFYTGKSKKYMPLEPSALGVLSVAYWSVSQPFSNYQPFDQPCDLASLLAPSSLESHTITPPFM